MILENPNKDEITFLPNADGDVLCMHCQQEDNIHRPGPNQLIGCEPNGGIRLFIHAAELRGYEGREKWFIDLYYKRQAAAMKGEARH